MARKEDTRDNVVGIGILFVSPNNALIHEYEPVIVGLELALQIPITSLTIFGDFKLIVKQLHGEHSAKERSDGSFVNFLG